MRQSDLRMPRNSLSNGCHHRQCHFLFLSLGWWGASESYYQYSVGLYTCVQYIYTQTTTTETQFRQS